LESPVDAAEHGINQGQLANAFIALSRGIEDSLPPVSRLEVVRCVILCLLVMMRSWAGRKGESWHSPIEVVSLSLRDLPWPMHPITARRWGRRGETDGMALRADPESG